MSYGYGLSATPLQIAQAYAALGNGGKLIAPTFVKGERHEPVQVLDPVIAGQIMRMMQTVTEPGGTAKQAAILGYHVAGKTGTARKFNESGGYSRRYVSFFAGVVPVQNPRFSMVVVINDPDPAKGYFGGFVSGPVFKNVMEGALRLMDVAPDDIDTWLAAQARSRSQARQGQWPAVGRGVARRRGAAGACRGRAGVDRPGRHAGEVRNEPPHGAGGAVARRRRHPAGADRHRPGARQPCGASGQCLRRDRRLRRAWPAFRRSGTRRGRGGDPVRTPGARRPARAGRRHRRAGPARAPGRDGRSLPRSRHARR